MNGFNKINVFERFDLINDKVINNEQAYYDNRNNEIITKSKMNQILFESALKHTERFCERYIKKNKKTALLKNDVKKIDKFLDASNKLIECISVEILLMNLSIISEKCPIGYKNINSIKHSIGKYNSKKEVDNLIDVIRSTRSFKNSAESLKESIITKFGSLDNFKNILLKGIERNKVININIPKNCNKDEFSYDMLIDEAKIVCIEYNTIKLVLENEKRIKRKGILTPLKSIYEKILYLSREIVLLQEFLDNNEFKYYPEVTLKSMLEEHITKQIKQVQRLIEKSDKEYYLLDTNSVKKVLYKYEEIYAENKVDNLYEKLTCCRNKSEAKRIKKQIVELILRHPMLNKSEYDIDIENEIKKIAKYINLEEDELNLRNKFYQVYLSKKINLKIDESMKYSLFLKKHIKKSEKIELLIKKEVERENLSDSIYGEYLKYYMSISNKKNAFSFDEYAKKRYGIEIIDVPVLVQDVLVSIIKETFKKRKIIKNKKTK